MALHEHSLDEDQLLSAKPNNQQPKHSHSPWFKPLVLGMLVTLAALFLTFVINSSFPGSYLIVPLGTIVSTFLGSLVFLVGCFLAPR